MSASQRSLPDLDPPSGFTIGDYWMVLYRRKWMILVVTVAAAFASTILSSRIEPRYEALAVFYVPENVAGGLFRGAEVGQARLPTGFQEHAKAYVTLLKGEDARRAIAARFPGRRPADLVRNADLVVTRESLIRVYVRDKDAAMAAEIANAHVDYFNQFHMGLVRQELEQSSTNLEKRRATVEVHKRGAEAARQAFQERERIASLDRELEELESQRAGFQEKLKSAEVEWDAAQQRVVALTDQSLEEDAAYRADQIVLQSPVIESLKASMTHIQIELAGLESELTPDHPTITALRKKYAKAKEDLQSEVSAVVQSKSKLAGSLYSNLRAKLTEASVDRSTAESRIGALRQVVDALDEKIRSKPAAVTELQRLVEAIERDDALIRKLESARADLIAEMEMPKDTIVVVDAAEAPARPVYPIPILNVGVAGFAGLVAGVLYALFLDHLETRRHRRRLEALQESEWAKGLLEDLAAPGERG